MSAILGRSRFILEDLAAPSLKTVLSFGPLWMLFAGMSAGYGLATDIPKH